MSIGLLVIACLLTLLRVWLIRSHALRTNANCRSAGDIGERRVTDYLEVSGAWDRLDNCVVGSDVHRSAQIDHLVRGRVRLVLIETKNWSGTLHGGPDDRDWLLERRDGSRTTMRNPLAQAARQAKVAARSAGVPVHILPLVAMAGNAVPAAGRFPEGVVMASALPRILPPLLEGNDEAAMEVVKQAWTRIVENVYDEDAVERERRYMSFLHARFDKRPWQPWLLLALLIAALSWFEGMSRFTASVWHHVD